MFLLITLLKKDDVYPIKDSLFENYKFPVPNNIEKVLLNILQYGKKLGVNFDYMHGHGDSLYKLVDAPSWYNAYQNLKEKVKETNILND